MPKHQSDSERLSFLRDYYAATRLIPSYGKLAELLGFRSASAAHTAMKRLMGEGYFELGEGSRLVPTDRFFELPIADAKIPAGSPLDIDGIGSSAGRIEELLVPNPSRSFLFQIDGDSMIDAGLLPGDYAVCERRPVPRPGDIVLAVADGEHTVKYLEAKGRTFFLRPGNRKYPSIEPKSLEIAGVVVGSFRKMT